MKTYTGPNGEKLYMPYGTWDYYAVLGGMAAVRSGVLCRFEIYKETTEGEDLGTVVVGPNNVDRLEESFRNHIKLHRPDVAEYMEANRV